MDNNAVMLIASFLCIVSVVYLFVIIFWVTMTIRNDRNTKELDARLRDWARDINTDKYSRKK